MTLALEESIVSKLEATSTVTALINTRIYPNVIPQDASLPAICYQKISARRPKCHDGANYCEARIQLTVRAATYTSAKAVFHAIRAVLAGFRGTLGSSGVTTFEITVENELDGYDQEAGYFTVRMDLLILHKDA